MTWWSAECSIAENEPAVTKVFVSDARSVLSARRRIRSSAWFRCRCLPCVPIVSTLPPGKIRAATVGVSGHVHPGEPHLDLRTAGAVGLQRALVDTPGGDLGERLEPDDTDRAEHRVVRRKLGFAEDHEELAAAGVRRTRLRHGQ